MRYFKYGRTPHLPWSPGVQSDDKMLPNCQQFEGKQVVVSLKMDGENTSCYFDGHIHARSIDSRGGEDRAWVKKFLTENVCPVLPHGWRVCGENLWAKHSIAYENLPSYFLGFSLWNEDICLPWSETVFWFELMGITPVKVLYEGLWDEKALHKVEELLDMERDEGYVVRLADSFTYEDFGKSIAKYVRANHVQTSKHWRQTVLEKNSLDSSNGVSA